MLFAGEPETSLIASILWAFEVEKTAFVWTAFMPIGFRCVWHLCLEYSLDNLE